MGNQVIYGYRTITRLLKKRDNLVINPKKVYRIMKENGWLCRARPKKGPSLGKPYYVTEMKRPVSCRLQKTSRIKRVFLLSHYWGAVPILKFFKLVFTFQQFYLFQNKQPIHRYFWRNHQYVLSTK